MINVGCVFLNHIKRWLDGKNRISFIEDIQSTTSMDGIAVIVVSSVLGIATVIGCFCLFALCKVYCPEYFVGKQESIPCFV